MEKYRTRLQMEIRSWKNAACVDATASSVCAEATLAVQRLSEAAVMELEAARPWPAEQAELAGKTISRLNAVALLAKDGSTPSMLDSELTFLDLALQCPGRACLAERRRPIGIGHRRPVACAEMLSMRGARGTKFNIALGQRDDLTRLLVLPRFVATSQQQEQSRSAFA